MHTEHAHPHNRTNIGISWQGREHRQQLRRDRHLLRRVLQAQRHALHTPRSGALVAVPSRFCCLTCNNPSPMFAVHLDTISGTAHHETKTFGAGEGTRNFLKDISSPTTQTTSRRRPGTRMRSSTRTYPRTVPLTGKRRPRWAWSGARRTSKCMLCP